MILQTEAQLQRKMCRRFFASLDNPERLANNESTKAMTERVTEANRYIESGWCALMREWDRQAV